MTYVLGGLALEPWLSGVLHPACLIYAVARAYEDYLQAREALRHSALVLVRVLLPLSAATVVLRQHDRLCFEGETAETYLLLQSIAVLPVV